jgi:hypothetical protein
MRTSWEKLAQYVGTNYGQDIRNELQNKITVILVEPVHTDDVLLKPGVPRINKLRIIKLLEADLNQVLRSAFARNISKLAQDTPGIISEHHYGRSHQTCLTPVLNKLLTVQLLIQMKTNGIVFGNDAKGCNDRIVSGIALAALRRIGYSKNSVRMLGLLWAQLEHHMATRFGVSDASYKSTTDKLLYGIGRGAAHPRLCGPYSTNFS